MLKMNLFLLLMLMFLPITAFTQNQESSSDEEAVKQVIRNETKNWYNVNYEGWAENWAHEKYVLSMGVGYGNPNSYSENLSWDSVKTSAKEIFNEYTKPLYIDLSWTDWNIRIFNDCAWASYMQTSIYEGNTQYPNKARQIRFLEKKNGDWKIVYSVSVNLSANNLEYNINDVGYKLLNEKKFKDAIDIFKKNVKLYPKSSNVYDSLGEAYMNNGDKELAIENYKKSLELDPKNENAKSMLNKLAEN